MMIIQMQIRIALRDSGPVLKRQELHSFPASPVTKNFPGTSLHGFIESSFLEIPIW